MEFLNNLTQEYLKSILEYSSKTGEFVWIVSKGFRIKKGEIAGSPNKNGYVQIKIDGRLYKVSRLAYLYMVGKWPKRYVDHKNGIKIDNTWKNLREVTRSQNGMNSIKRITSKFKGVSWHNASGKYQCRLRLNKKAIHIGAFDTEKEAALAYNYAAIKHFGEFANLNDVKGAKNYD